MSPVADGPVGLLGRLAGHGDDSDDLLGGEGGGTAGPWRVVEGGFDHAEQILIGGLGLGLGLGGGQARGGLEPSVTPEADADAGEAQVRGDFFQAGLVGQGEQDVDAAGQAHRGGLAAAQVFERGPLARREGDARGTRAAHVTTRFSWQDRYLLLVYSL